MKKALVKYGTWFLSKLPWWCMDVVSFKLYVLAYYLMGYRKKVVRDNLLKSFPDKTPSELKAIEKKFYKHFADIITETIKGATITEQEILNRYTVKNPEVAKEVAENPNTSIILYAHYNNWEWNAMFYTLYFNKLGLKMNAAYKPLSDRVMEEYMLNYRSRFGGRLIPSTQSREMIRTLKSTDPLFFIMIADQVPNKENVLKVNFLGRETSFFKGPAWMALNTDNNIYYTAVRKTARHKYDVEFIKLHDARDVVEDKTKKIEEITAKYAYYLEQQIQEEPATWLWSHKRWKHDPSSNY